MGTTSKAIQLHKKPLKLDRQKLKGYMFLTPFLILFILFTVVPVLQAIGISFTYFNNIQPAKWIGIINYRNLLTEDDIFLIALKNTFFFAIIVGPVGYFLSFFFAWAINQFKFKTGFALAFYLPSITSGIVMSQVFLYFFSNDRYGLLNNILYRIGFIQQPIMWTTDPNYILKVVMIISIWMSMGTGFLVFLAGLQNVSKDLYEAAAIDGIKNKFQELIYITLPSMKPQLLFGAISTITASFSVFEIAAAVAPVPSPDYAAHTVVAHLFDKAFIRFEMGYACSIAVCLFAITFVLGKLCMRLISSKGE